MKYLKKFEGNGKGFDLESEKDKAEYELSKSNREKKPHISTVEISIPGIKAYVSEGGHVTDEHDYFLKKAAQKGDIDLVKYLLQNGCKIESRRYMSIKIAAEYGKYEILSYLLSKIDGVTSNNIDDWKNWIRTSDSLSDEDKQRSIDIFDEFRTSKNL